MGHEQTSRLRERFSKINADRYKISTLTILRVACFFKVLLQGGGLANGEIQTINSPQQVDHLRKPGDMTH